MVLALLLIVVFSSCGMMGFLFYVRWSGAGVGVGAP